MTALTLTFAALLFALIVGLAVTACLRTAVLSVQDILLAPATGIAVTMAVVVELNRSGLAVGSFGPWLIAIVGLVAVVCVRVRWRAVRPALQGAFPFFIIAVIAVLLVAAPMVSFGSNWFSYANDDGVNYAFSAERMKMGGLFAVPPQAIFAENRDARLDYYFLNAVPSERYGVDEELALFSAGAQESAFRVLMPFLVVLGASGLLAAAALVYRGTLGRTYAIALAAALCVSALSTFGIDDQLLGQAGGLLFMSAALARCCDDDALTGSMRERAGAWMLAIIVVAGLFLSYPEITPFAIMAIAAYHLLSISSLARARAAFLGVVALGTALILNAYIRNVLFVLSQRTAGTHGNQGLNPLFPYYLLPSGMANLFGVLPIASFPAEPISSGAILLGFLFTAATLVATIRCIAKRQPAGYLAVLYAIAGCYFFAERGGFALYKLAMYAEPALLAVLAVMIVDGVVSKWWYYRGAAAACAVAFVVVNIPSQHAYIVASRTSLDSRSANFAEIPNISGGRLFDNLEELRRDLGPREAIYSDAFNPVLGRIEQYYARERATVAFPSDTSGQSIWDGLVIVRHSPFFDHSRDEIAKRLSAARSHNFAVEMFDPGPGYRRADPFFARARSPEDTTRLWLTGPTNSPFNRLRSSAEHEISSVSPHTRNILAFVPSNLGLSYFTHADPIAVYQLEPDFFDQRRSMSGIGRFLLLEVANPRSPIRLHLAFTDTLTGDGENRLPPASIIGTKAVTVGIHGRGSASVISPPIVPQVLGGRAYVLIDMGAEPKRFRYERRGLMRLWGRDLAIDPRSLTAFLRDASAVSDPPSPPESITSFPRDLLATAAQYSGIYEDGWASEDFWTTLTVGESGRVVLRGVVPLIQDPHFTTLMSVYVDGFRVSSQELNVGEVVAPAMTGSGVHRIEWRFSRYQRLPGNDHRPVGLLIHSIS